MKRQEFEIGDSVLVCTAEVGFSGVLHSAVIEDWAVEDTEFGVYVSGYLVRVERKWLGFRWTKRVWLLKDKVFGKSSLTPEVQQLNEMWRKS